MKKARKINYQATHPGNNKQDVNLALAILDETTTAAILSYFPERNDAAQLLSLFHKLFITLNSKQMFNTSNQLGNAAVKGDKKPTFYGEITNWIEIWSTCECFTLTKQTSHALITTLCATASLIDDLLEESCTFVLTSRLQTDPLELRFSKYRQMSGGRFLVSLLEVCNSEKILAVRSLLKEDIIFWDENIYQTFDIEYSTLENIMQDIALLSSEILECQLSEDSMEVAVTIAGYIAKKLKKRFKCLSCGQKMVSTDQDVLNNEYLKILSRGGLICPSQSLSDFICHLFSILDIVSPILIKHCTYSLSIKSFAEQIFKIYYCSVDFTSEKHQEWGIKYVSRIVINIFYNNLQKETTDSVRKDQVKEFKKRQRTDS